MGDPATPSTTTSDTEEPPGQEPPIRHRRRFDPTVVVALIAAAASIAVAAITVGVSGGDDAKSVPTEGSPGVKPVNSDPFAQGCGRDMEPLGESATKKGVGTVQVFRSEACHAKWVVLTEGEALVTFYMAPEGHDDDKHRKWGTVDGTYNIESVPEKYRRDGSSNVINAFHTPLLSADIPVMGCVRNKGKKDRVCTEFL
ncbi:hypothetical protein [Streptomyces sp. GESEQ-35]|uniref:hypothetical protein n=1 Tax=Streptomyces sp. GESEQ-35 TaxID=2812657 RepID=UPI001B31A66E|nr:hypothetical protein [Streptomyces sp. GESEQ-35]